MNRIGDKSKHMEFFNKNLGLLRFTCRNYRQDKQKGEDCLASRTNPRPRNKETNWAYRRRLREDKILEETVEK